jgi:alpha-1,6-mannosyltransferase
MKICDVIQFYSPLSGGIKNYVHTKAIWFAENRQDVEHFVIVPGEKDEEFKIGNSTFYSIKSPRLPFSKSYRLLCSKRKIERLLIKEEPDVLETCDPYITAQICKKLSLTHNIPLVAFYHSDFPRTIPPQIRKLLGSYLSSFLSKCAKRYLKKLYKPNKALVVASSSIASALQSEGFENIVNIPLGIDTEMYVPVKDAADIREKYGISNEKKMIFFVGRFCFEKNILNLVNAFKILHERSDDVQLVLVGDGELKDKIFHLSEGIDDIHILPYCENKKELLKLYSTADVFVHPGVLETFGFVAVEAQSCGTKVVSVKDSVVSEGCVHDEDNVLADSPSAEALASAIEKSLISETSWEERLARHKAIEERFSNDITYSRITKLYEKAAKSSFNI